MTRTRSPYLKAADRAVKNNAQPGLLAFLLALLVVGVIVGGLIWLNIEIWGDIF